MDAFYASVELLRGLKVWDALPADARTAVQDIHVEGDAAGAALDELGQGERDKAGLAFNELVRTGQVSAPLVIGRDHLDTGSVASPYRETESMLDGSDAIADWPLLNALVNTASGATCVSIHHGGGVGIGRSMVRATVKNRCPSGVSMTWVTTRPAVWKAAWRFHRGQVPPNRENGNWSPA